MKRTYKLILGGIGLAAFAVATSFFIISHDRARAEAQISEDVAEEATEDFSITEDTEKILTFPDERGFSEEELSMDEDEPEGREYYGDDEPEPMYHVMIENFEELYTKYNDWKICNELPYYLHTYFNLCTGDLKEYYTVTLTEGSCICSDSTALITLEATVDKYPGMEIHIEYDKLNREFGIRSMLGDYSLDALRERHAEEIFTIEDVPEDEIDLGNAEKSSLAQDADDDD